MTTLTREAIQIVQSMLLKEYNDNEEHAKEQARWLVNQLSQLRGFAMFATDDTRPAYGLDWKLGHDQEVTQHDLDAANVIDQGPKMFEKAFGFGTLPWDSTPEWTNLRKFVTEIYSHDKLAFGNYVVWRASKEGQYRAMNNKQIRLNPKVFMDTGWPEFENSTVKAEPSETTYETL